MSYVGNRPFRLKPRNYTKGIPSIQGQVPSGIESRQPGWGWAGFGREGGRIAGVRGGILYAIISDGKEHLEKGYSSGDGCKVGELEVGIGRRETSPPTPLPVCQKTGTRGEGSQGEDKGKVGRFIPRNEEERILFLCMVYGWEEPLLILIGLVEDIVRHGFQCLDQFVGGVEAPGGRGMDVTGFIYSPSASGAGDGGRRYYMSRPS